MDFHCHLDLYPNAKAVYADTLVRNEFTWLVTTSPRAFAATSKILPSTERLLISPGLHPEVADRKAVELDLLMAQLESVKAVGEVGLDGSTRYKHTFNTQQKIFSAVVARSESLGGRILSVHSRTAASEVLSTLESHPSFGIAVLHWFADSPSALRRATALGCWFSVGPAMLSSANGRNLASLMPRERVIPESDGPFGKVGGRTLMPWEAITINESLSKLWNLSKDEVSTLLRSNGQRLRSLMTQD